MAKSPVDRAVEPAAPEVGEHRRKGGRQGGFGRDVLKVVTGSFFAQGISIVLSPILARLYAPQAFGVWGVFSSITTIIGVVACLRYEVAMMIPETDEEGASLLGVSLVAVTTVSVLAALAVLTGRSTIVAALKAPEIAPWLWLIPVAVFVNGIYLASLYWSMRRRRFGRASSARVSGSAASSAVQLAVGYGGAATAGGLIASSIAGTGVSFAVLGTKIVREDGRVLRTAFRWRTLWREGLRHRKFPLYGSVAILMNTVSWQLPAILLQRFFSAEVVGFYALGNRLLRVPMDLLGGAISQVFYQRAAAARVSGRLAEIVESAYRRLVTISLAPMIVLGITASDIFRVVFGGRWAEAGVYTEILSIWTFFWFISSPLSTVLAVQEKQELGLKLNVLILVTRLATLVAGGLLGGPRLTLVLFAGSGVLVYGYFSYVVLSAAGVSRRSALRVLGSAVGSVAPIAALLLAGRLARVPSWIEVTVGALSMGGYFLVMFRRDPALADLLKSIVPAGPNRRTAA